MYGYVRPLKPELKVKQYEAFRGVYCGLCHELRRRYGPAARFLVNYDFTFLAMLLSDGEAPVCARRRCPVSPFRKRACLAACGELSAAADMSVILGFYKLTDGVRDDGFFKALLCRLGRLFLRGAFRKAAAARPGFARSVRERLAELDALETGRCDSIDRTADKFALLLQSAADDIESESRRRVTRELLYHLGRYIYLLDAADDLQADAKAGSYNPLAARYGVTDGGLSPENAAELKETVRLSLSRAAAAFALLDPSPWTDILQNTVLLGLPAAAEAVFAGTWRHNKKKSPTGAMP